MLLIENCLNLLSWLVACLCEVVDLIIAVHMSNAVGFARAAVILC